MGIQAFFIRGGQNWGHRSFFPAHTADVPEDEVLSQFLDAILRGGAARRAPSCVDRELPEAELLAEASRRAGRPQGRARRSPSAAPAAG